MCTHFNSSAMPAQYRTKSRTIPKTYLPSREPRVADADTGLMCQLSSGFLDAAGLKTGFFNRALVSITRFSSFTTAPLDWRLSFLPTFEPHSKIPSAIFTNNNLPLRGGLQGCRQGNLSTSRIYNRGIHVDSSRACRTVHSSALVVTRS